MRTEVLDAVAIPGRSMLPPYARKDLRLSAASHPWSEDQGSHTWHPLCQPQ